MTIRSTAAVAAALLGLCLPAQAVVGGSATRDPNGLRRSVARVEGSSGQLCSGTIVAPDLVLTAAHCIAGRTSYRVVALDRAFRARPLPVAAVLIHPTFVPGTTPQTQPGTDLALLKLGRPLGSDFLPLDAARAAQASPGDRMLLAGFGLGDVGRRGRVRTLRVADLVASGSLQMANRVLVAVGPTSRIAGACRGDSGGPVLAGAASGYALVGIVSWASGGDGRNCGNLTAITPLAEHGSWLREGAARLGQGSPRSRQAGR